MQAETCQYFRWVIRAGNQTHSLTHGLAGCRKCFHSNNGIGGIATPEDAIEFLLAGATAVQIGTANFINPQATEEIIQGIGKYLEKQGIASIEDLIGKARV